LNNRGPERDDFASQSSFDLKADLANIVRLFHETPTCFISGRTACRKIEPQINADERRCRANQANGLLG
jgi:hypothetical protein